MDVPVNKIGSFKAEAVQANDTAIPIGRDSMCPVKGVKNICAESLRRCRPGKRPVTLSPSATSYLKKQEG